MKKVFLILGAFLIFASCSEDRTEISELSVEYKIPKEVLESQEFNQFLSSMKDAMEVQSKKQDDFFIATTNDTQKLAAIKDIQSQIQKENLSPQEAELLYLSRIGVSPIDVKIQKDVKKNREIFFDKFPEYKGNQEKLLLLENYFKKEVIDYEAFMAGREKEVMNKIEN